MNERGGDKSGEWLLSDEQFARAIQATIEALEKGAKTFGESPAGRREHEAAEMMERMRRHMFDEIRLRQSWQHQASIWQERAAPSHVMPTLPVNVDGDVRRACCGGVIHRDPGGPEYPCADCPDKPDAVAWSGNAHGLTALLEENKRLKEVAERQMNDAEAARLELAQERAAASVEHKEHDQRFFVLMARFSRAWENHIRQYGNKMDASSNFNVGPWFDPLKVLAEQLTVDLDAARANANYWRRKWHEEPPSSTLSATVASEFSCQLVTALADKFGVARPTLVGWLSGEVVPEPAFQKFVLEAIRRADGTANAK